MSNHPLDSGELVAQAGEPITTIATLASQWQHIIQSECLTPNPHTNGPVIQTRSAPLHCDGHTSCTGHQDGVITEAAYRSLLCEPEEVTRLDLAHSTIPNVELNPVQTLGDADSMVIRLTSLAAHKGGFSLLYYL